MEHSAATDKNGQAGFSLPELLLVMILAVIVIGLPLTLAVSSFSAQNQSASRSASAARAQIGIDRLVRDLRQSITASITSTQAPATAVLTIPTKRVNNLAAAQPATQVTWICTTGATCTRTTGGGDVRQLIPGVTAATFTPTFFAGATGPSRVDVSVTAQVLDERRGATETLSGADAVTFRDGVDLRNSR